MSNVRVSVTDNNDFRPIDIKIELSIKTKQELMDMKYEFSEGDFEVFTTQFSNILYDVIDGLKSTIERI